MKHVAVTLQHAQQIALCKTGHPGQHVLYLVAVDPSLGHGRSTRIMGMVVSSARMARKRHRATHLPAPRIVKWRTGGRGARVLLRATVGRVHERGRSRWTRFGADRSAHLCWTATSVVTAFRVLKIARCKTGALGGIAPSRAAVAARGEPKSSPRPRGLVAFFAPLLLCKRNNAISRRARAISSAVTFRNTPLKTTYLRTTPWTDKRTLIFHKGVRTKLKLRHTSWPIMSMTHHVASASRLSSLP
jgi:hypothetical protein